MLAVKGGRITYGCHRQPRSSHSPLNARGQGQHTHLRQHASSGMCMACTVPRRCFWFTAAMQQCEALAAAPAPVAAAREAHVCALVCQRMWQSTNGCRHMSQHGGRLCCVPEILAWTSRAVRSAPEHQAAPCASGQPTHVVLWNCCLAAGGILLHGCWPQHQQA